MSTKLYLVLFVWSVALALQASGADPYGPGRYKVEEYRVTPEHDQSPLGATVYYPSTPGKYSVMMFIGGMYAILPNGIYSKLQEYVASHGFIVVGVDRFLGSGENVPDYLSTKQVGKGLSALTTGHLGKVQYDVNAEGDKFFQQFYWLRENINDRTKAIPDWSRAALMCHSAGCDDSLIMVNKSRSLVKASIFLDPVSAHIKKIVPITDDIKVLTYVSQLSEFFPACCIHGEGWKAIYNLFEKTKVRMNVRDFGHCDVLDHTYWQGCHTINFCQTTNDTFINGYKLMTAGIVSSFMQWTVEGNEAMKKYVIDPTLMPFDLVEISHHD